MWRTPNALIFGLKSRSLVCKNTSKAVSKEPPLCSSWTRLICSGFSFKQEKKKNKKALMDWTQQIRWTRAGPLWSLIWSSGLLKNGNGHRGIAFSPGVREFSALMNVEDKARYSSLAACYSHPGSFLTQLLSFRRPHCFCLNPTYL